MVSQLLRESIGQAREAPTLHADREIAALHVARADALGAPGDPCAVYAYYVTGRVAAGRIRTGLAVEYFQYFLVGNLGYYRDFLADRGRSVVWLITRSISPIDMVPAARCAHV